MKLPTIIMASLSILLSNSLFAVTSNAVPTFSKWDSVSTQQVIVNKDGDDEEEKEKEKDKRK